MGLNFLDNFHKIETLDRYSMRISINSIKNQIKEIIDFNSNFSLPKNYKKIDQIVLFGMGGSALGAHLIQSLFNENLKVPFLINNSYEIPNFINENTLVIFSSYSGNTEEIINAFKQLQKTKAKSVVLTKGGILKKLAEQHKIPLVLFEDKNNPCESPRMGLSYSIFGLLLILNSIEQISLSDINLKKISKAINQAYKNYSLEAITANNLTKKLALAQNKKTVWFIGAEFLSGNTHIAANQINENTKKFGGYFLLPELNHHLLEGLSYPLTNSENIFFIFIESKKYSSKIIKRIEITKKILTKKEIEFGTIFLTSNTKIEQAFECLVASSYLSFYGAMLNEIDPTPVKEVDFFKEEMSK